MNDADLRAFVDRAASRLWRLAREKQDLVRLYEAEDPDVAHQLRGAANAYEHAAMILGEETQVRR